MRKDRNLVKKVEECIQYYLKYINSDKYKIDKLLAKSRDDINHSAFIESQKPHWKNRTDFYEASFITNVSVYDILSNDGVIKLLKKLYSLPSEKFKVKNYYLKSSLRNKYDYVHLQYLHSSSGIFSEIELLDDNYISNITIYWGQINSFYAFFEYHFSFKNALDEKKYDAFVYDNISKLNKKDYRIWYHIIDNLNDSVDWMLLEQMNREYFPLIIQHYITTYFYSEQGGTNQLTSMTYMTRKEPIHIDTMYLSDLGVSYYNKESNYVITSDFRRKNHWLMSGNNQIPSFRLYGYVSRYGNEFYNMFFGERDLEIFEADFSQFTTGRRKMTYNGELKKLLNKIQSLSEIESRKYASFYDDFNRNWSFYIANDESNIKEYYCDRMIEYPEIYRKNFEYLKILSEINYAQGSRYGSFIATVASVVAVIIALFN